MIASRAHAPLATLCFVLAGLAGCAQDEPDPRIPQYDAFHDLNEAPAAIQTASNAVVRIRFPAGYATGSFISGDGLLLTNNHVLGVDVCPKEGCWFDLSFAYQRGVKLTAPVTVFGVPVHVDPGLDVAVIQVKSDPAGSNLATPSFLSFRRAASTELVGSSVYVVGHPEGHLKKWSTGVVAYADGNWMVTSAFSLPGNSGSPFLDAQGHIVGILHRGPTAIDLVSAHAVSDYSVGTASAPMIDALSAPLPPTMRSVDDPIDAKDLVALHRLYLGAHQPLAKVADKPTSVLSILASACDAELAKGGFRSLDDLIDRTVACTQAHEWFSCNTTDAPPMPWKTCPLGDDKTAWITRFEALFDARRAFNGEVWGSPITTYRADLETSEGAAKAAVQERLAKLAAESPALDFNLAYYFAAWDVDDVSGRSVRDMIGSYDRVPQYQLEAQSIVSAATWLRHYGRISATQLDTLLGRLAADDTLPLGARLSVDDLRWQGGH